jgi:hypothetical protein
MKTLFGCIVGIALTVTLSSAQNAAIATWKTFVSSTGFSVRYPENWFRKGISKDRLMILSSEGGAEAIVIKKGQAMIFVVEASEYPRSSLSQVIDRYTQNVAVLSRQDITNKEVVGRGCHDLREIVSKERVVPSEDVPKPAPYLINTEFFCEIDEHVYVTALRNFECDKKQAMYQQTALRIAKSLQMDE